ncbi:MAG: acyl-CoA thioesterase [Candidatus Hydrogenedentes bacterium]|nr:acyl-CoA thioesterase [Candidatus Hydrogenedentota bacterium]
MASACSTLRKDFGLLVPITVRWGDMDAYGHVNNATFSTYFETARMKFFEWVRVFDYKEGERHAPAIVSATINYRQQVHYPAELEAGIRCIKVGTKSFTLEHFLFRAGADEIVADGTTVIAWVDYAAGKAVPLPEQSKDALSAGMH